MKKILKAIVPHTKKDLVQLLGYGIIFAAIQIFGHTVMWTSAMWLQIIMVSFGGAVLIRSGSMN